ncbi:unnamed protein product [Arctogadus glacialis]
MPDSDTCRKAWKPYMVPTHSYVPGTGMEICFLCFILHLRNILITYILIWLGEGAGVLGCRGRRGEGG